METIIGIIIFAVIYFACKSSFNNQVDNYDISRVNTSKMVADKVNNNLSNTQVQRNMINGNMTTNLESIMFTQAKDSK